MDNKIVGTVDFFNNLSVKLYLHMIFVYVTLPLVAFDHIRYVYDVI